jgi:hypothetical protein
VYVPDPPDAVAVNVTDAFTVLGFALDESVTEITGCTVSVTVFELTIYPAESVTLTLIVGDPVGSDVVDQVEEVALLTAEPFRYHWYVNGLVPPETVEENVTDWP